MTREEIIANILLCIELEGDDGISSFITEESEEMIAFMNQLCKDNILADEGFVDLGLPSGTLWAKCNLDATKPSDFGKFYQWGDIKGYPDINAHQFNYQNYKWRTCDNLVNDFGYKLLLRHDPIFTATLGEFKLPTMEQFQELIEHTDHEWTKIDNVHGMKFINKSDSTKYIFIPAAGSCSNEVHNGIDFWCNVWSASLDEADENLAWSLYFSENNLDLMRDSRCDGFTVRGVLNK